MIAKAFLTLAIVAALSYVTLSFKTYASRNSVRMSSESSMNEISIADVSKGDVNRILQATASVMTAFSMASAANAYGNI